MSREAILGRIRLALGRTGRVAATPRHANLGQATLAPATPGQANLAGGAPPSLTSTGAAAIARFRVAAAAKGIDVIDVADDAGIPAAVASYLGPDPAGHALRLGSNRLAGLDWRDRGIDIATGAATAADRVGLSRAIAGIAETGTLLLASGPEDPATLALLPETHVVVLERAAIVGTFEDAVAVLRQTYGSALPRAVNFISGASRTGDIGGRIVHGAHGPRRLAVLVVENKQGAARAP
jgi:L-lactate dehydrogenase complex protein LldG